MSEPNRPWRLALADLSSAEAESLVLPRVEPREMLRVGWDAKLRFIPATGAKVRFMQEEHWVHVEIVHDEGARYEGTLKTEPHNIKGLPIGAMIDFGPAHVIDFIFGQDSARLGVQIRTAFPSAVSVSMPDHKSAGACCMD